MLNLVKIALFGVNKITYIQIIAKFKAHSMLRLKLTNATLLGG